jgi:hypothetical protein
MIGDVYLDTGSITDYVRALDSPFPLYGLPDDAWVGPRKVSAANEDDGVVVLIHGARSDWGEGLAPRLAVAVQGAMGAEQSAARMVSDAISILHRDREREDSDSELDYAAEEALHEQLWVRAKELVTAGDTIEVVIDGASHSFSVVQVGPRWRARANVGDAHVALQGCAVSSDRVCLVRISDLRPYASRVARRLGPRSLAIYRAALRRRERSLSHGGWVMLVASDQLPLWKRLRSRFRLSRRKWIDRHIHKEPWPEPGDEDAILASPPYPVYELVTEEAPSSCGVSQYHTMTPDGVGGIHVSYGDWGDSGGLDVQSERPRNDLPVVTKHHLEEILMNFDYSEGDHEYWVRLAAIPEDDWEALHAIYADAPWVRRAVEVDGTLVEFQVLEAGPTWAAIGDVGGTRVILSGRSRPLDDVSLRRAHELTHLRPVRLADR